MGAHTELAEGRHWEGEGDSEGDSAQTTVRQREQAAAREAESYHQVKMAR